MTDTCPRCGKPLGGLLCRKAHAPKPPKADPPPAPVEMMTCEREGCEVQFPAYKRGMVKRFCSRRCRKLAANARDKEKYPREPKPEGELAENRIQLMRGRDERRYHEPYYNPDRARQSWQRIRACCDGFTYRNPQESQNG